ncbi:hypothetical protein QTO30_00495 [Yoonia sp. GPGPB17]
MRGKIAMNHSKQVAFGSDASVKGTGTKPKPIIAAPKSAAYLSMLEIVRAIFFVAIGAPLQSISLLPTLSALQHFCKLGSERPSDKIAKASTAWSKSKCRLRGRQLPFVGNKIRSAVVERVKDR